MPQRRNDAPKEDWLCRTCQFRGGVPFRDFGTNKRCRGGCDLDKVNCYQGPAIKPGKQDPARHIPGLASKQQQQHQQQMQQVQNQNKVLTKQLKEALEKGKPDESSMEVDTIDHPDAAKKELQKRIAYLEGVFKLAKDSGQAEEESYARELEDTRLKLKEHMPTAGKHSLAQRKLKQASDNRAKAQTALDKSKEALAEAQNKVAENVANLAAKKMQEEQARAEFLQSSAVHAGAGSMPMPMASTSAFFELEPKYIELLEPSIRAFYKGDGIKALRAAHERQTMDNQAEAARKLEEAQAITRTEAQVVCAAAAAAATAQAVIETAAAFEAEALTEPAFTEEADDEEAEDDEFMDDFFSPESLAVLASSDPANRRAVFKRMVKNHRKPGAESQAKKGKRG